MACNGIMPVAAAAFVLALNAPAAAQPVAEFYRGKNVSVIVGFPPGGGYDANSRVLARHMGRFIPGNPNVVASNMPSCLSFPLRYGDISS